MMFKMINVVCICCVISLGLASGQAAAQESEYAKYKKEVCTPYYESTKSMYAMVDEIKVLYADDPEILADILKNQERWQAYHDGYIEAMYGEPYVSPMSDRHLCVCRLMTPVVEVRLQQLRYWRDGTFEGDVCGGNARFYEEEQDQ
jgi:hypothetical protein